MQSYLRKDLKVTPQLCQEILTGTLDDVGSAFEAQWDQGNGSPRPLGHRKVHSFHGAPAPVAAARLSGWVRADRGRDPGEHLEDDRWCLEGCHAFGGDLRRQSRAQSGGRDVRLLWSFLWMERPELHVLVLPGQWRKGRMAAAMLWRVQRAPKQQQRTHV